MQAKRATGERFGALVVVADGDTGSQRRVVAKCDCGKISHVRIADLRSGNTKSCGCLKAPRGGLSNTPEGKAWSGMIRRCSDPAVHNYHRYGGRGIRVCDRWLSSDGLANFYADIGQRPTPQHTLERKDTDGNYEPGNCVWATKKAQCNNRSTNRLITAFGETKTLSQWSESTGIGVSTLWYRIRRMRMTPEQAIRTPVKKG